MEKLSIWAKLEAKEGKEKELEAFLESALPLAEQEPGTISWYALKLSNSEFAIFDTFEHEKDRDAHLNGKIAEALFAKADELLKKSPDISKPEILAVKTPGVR